MNATTDKAGRTINGHSQQLGMELDSNAKAVAEAIESVATMSRSMADVVDVGETSLAVDDIEFLHARIATLDRAIAAYHLSQEKVTLLRALRAIL